MHPRAARVAHALYRALIADGRHDVTALARRIAVAPSTLYSWAEGKATAPAWAPLAIYDATGDLELFLELTGIRDAKLIVTRAPVVDSHADVAPTLAALKVGAETGELQTDVLKADADGVVTDAELAEIEADIDRAQRRLEELRAAARTRRFRVVGGTD